MAERTEPTGKKAPPKRKSAVKGGDGVGDNGASGTGKGPRAAARSKAPELKKDLRDFASGRPEGWNHDDWLSFLESLQSRGHDIANREAIGLALEMERLDLALSGVKGLGPQRRKALIERYGNLWSLRNADPAEIAQVANLPRPLAEQVKNEMR